MNNRRVFAVIGAKGGSGTTTICTDIARGMRNGHTVTLVDGDLSGRRNLAVILDAVAEIDASRHSSKIGITRKADLGLIELAASYDAAFTISQQDVEAFVSATSDAEILVADVPLPFAGQVRPIIARATRLLIVTEPSLLGIASATTLLGDLRRFGVPSERVAAVRSCRENNHGISRDEIESALHITVLGDLPPMTDRGYSKALSRLISSLNNIPTAPMIETLLPSIQGFFGDRRGAQAPQSGQSHDPAPHTNGATNQAPVRIDLRSTTIRDQLKSEVHRKLSERVNLIDAAGQADSVKLAQLREQVSQIAQGILSKSAGQFTAEELATMKDEIVSETLGLGPVEDLMRDPDVSEIMVNGYQTIYVERNGRLELTDKRFGSAQQLRLVLERILSPLGRRLDESSPMVDARLPDGSRVNAIVEPLAIKGATLTIRRFGIHRMTAQDLIDKGSAHEAMIDFLRACVQARLNILISGGTGSGKTTFLNIVSSFISESERIVTVEDSAELFLAQPHVVSLETRPANVEGKGEVTIRDIVKNALRMRPDRIIIGEVRGGEALDMLQAMNTGHDGSLTTVHANSPHDALSRVETMVMMAGFDLPVRVIREQVSNAIDLVVQTARMRDGSRKIVSMSEIVGMEGEIVTMQNLVTFKQRGLDADDRVAGEFKFSGVQPDAIRRFEEYGIPYDIRALSTMAGSEAVAAW
jgi:pilus assembly protein CpaF